MALKPTEQDSTLALIRPETSPLGARLREARKRWNLTLKEVEARSQALALEWGNPSYAISYSWLYRIEMEQGEVSATKLIVLAVIYSLSPKELLDFAPAGAEHLAAKFDQPSRPNSTVLLEAGTLREHAERWLPDAVVTAEPPTKSALLSSDAENLPTSYKRAIVGKNDRTLEPLVPPGSLLLIDTSKVSIASRREWAHEFDRPIYFLMTHEGYITGFCELDKNAEWLTVVPHALSPEMNRRWRYKREIEVIGTVKAVMTRR